MNKNLPFIYFLIIIVSIACSQNSIGIFKGNNDIGKTGLKGSVIYDSKNESYTISGSGENMWFDKDAFHYVWKKIEGDAAISTELNWQGNGVNPHRKAGVIIRQNLEPGAAYADVVVHGDGLTSLQYREIENGQTHEIQANIKAPDKVKLERTGNYVYMSVGVKGEDLKSAGGCFKLELSEPYYIGLGVCSHDSTVSESAIFSNVKIKQLDKNIVGEKMVESTLETINIESTDRRVVFNTKSHIEAPNWTSDGKTLIYNSNGLLFKIPVEGGAPEKINTDFADKCNNDHGLSPDNKQIVISHHTKDDSKSRIYTLPIDGGIPKLVTKNAPSYWHGWSPDGNTLAYCAERDGQYDIYTIPVNGGKEIQLTDTEGLDDGPEYSPDGKFIYFNSVRTGKMQIWRMNADGSKQTRVTNDEYNNWFPHPSPDGNWIVFVSYEKDVEGHPANKDVMLRIMPAAGGEVKTLTKLFGGQGTINVPSWSPDSKQIAFVSYKLVSK
ncbi:MAG: TolB family protein [Melioribacteraceae bacterium]|nr:TolB family protein [Melioribacteraceae bacterium]